MGRPTLEPSRADVRIDRAVDEVLAQLKSHASHPRLELFLDQCKRRGLLRVFCESDARALMLQDWHRRCAFLAILGAVLASCLGVAQLAFFGPWIQRFGIPVAEAALFALATLAVVVDLVASLQERWLLSRFEAEGHRLTIFQLVADPRLWAKNSWTDGDWELFFAMSARDRRPTKGDLRALAEGEEVPRIWHPGECPAIGKPDVLALVRYYVDGLIRDQIRYFQNKIDEAERKSWLQSPYLSFIVFCAGVAFVVAHLWKEREFERDPSHAEAAIGSALWLAASVCVALGWAAFRTWRSANELSRNALRAHARKNTLEGHVVRLATEAGKDSPDMCAIFNTLSACQQLLRSDQREWLRLMSEAEWY